MAPSISEVLSQHEMLTMLCGYISSADLIHLAATSKEHWTYIVQSPQIYEKLRSDAVCDGSGVIAQRRLFGDMEHNDGRPVHQCLGADARPCDDCGANVCENCRFHFKYPSEFPSHMEAARAEKFLTGLVEEEMIRDGMDGVSSIQYRKAWDIYWRPPNERFCIDCHPLILSDEFACRCTFFDHFVGKRWLCIPCFLLEDTAVIKKYFRRRTSSPEDCFYDRDDIPCNCGQPPLDRSSEFCRYCDRAHGWYSDMDSIWLNKVHEQLGYQPEKQGEMKAILEQLG